MYSIAAIISGKTGEEKFTVHRFASSVEQMYKILDALITLGADNLSITRHVRRREG